ncbi:hypothetical protein J4205_03035 [Candidatus Pacearchaeota archaeon]|nr:hypothetical protein [Candidatus Pacearchaeota archaeon]
MEYDELRLDELRYQVINYFEGRFKKFGLRYVQDIFPSKKVIGSSSELCLLMENLGNMAESYLTKVLGDLEDEGKIKIRVVDGKFMDGVRAIHARRQSFRNKIEDNQLPGNLEREIQNLTFSSEYNIAGDNTLAIYVYYRDIDLIIEAIEAV